MINASSHSKAERVGEARVSNYLKLFVLNVKSDMSSVNGFIILTCSTFNGIYSTDTTHRYQPQDMGCADMPIWTVLTPLLWGEISCSLLLKIHNGTPAHNG